MTNTKTIRTKLAEAIRSLTFARRCCTDEKVIAKLVAKCETLRELIVDEMSDYEASETLNAIAHVGTPEYLPRAS